uniref:Uncharacterized protein n=1 Tax=Eptatretus burgeri TaxID=7764 RepID=A0A8C4QWX0_EPTBU
MADLINLLENLVNSFKNLPLQTHQSECDQIWHTRAPLLFMVIGEYDKNKNLSHPPTHFCHSITISIPGGPSVLFLEPGGLLLYTWPVRGRPSTRADRLTVWFATLVSNAVLVRIDSAPSLGDFLELRLVSQHFCLYLRAFLYL